MTHERSLAHRSRCAPHRSGVVRAAVRTDLRDGARAGAAGEVVGGEEGWESY